MSKVNLFLRVLKNEGYPNPDLQSIAKMIGYDTEYFLVDLKNEIGEEGVLDFCDKAIEKTCGKDGLRIDLDGPNGDEYVYIKIYPIFYDEGESENDVVSRSKWGESKLLGTDDDGNEKFMTIEEIIDNTDMGGWAELDELLDNIKALAYNKIYNNCGFGIWWE